MSRKKGETKFNYKVRKAVEEEEMVCGPCDAEDPMTTQHVFCDCKHVGVGAARERMLEGMRENAVMEKMSALGDWTGEGWMSVEREGEVANCREAASAQLVRKRRM